MSDEALLSSLSESIQIEDLPNEQLQWIAQEIGIKAAVKVCMHLDGVNIYVPKRTKRNLKIKYAKKTYTGSNARALALQLGVTEQTIYEWLRIPSGCVQTNLFPAKSDE